MASLTAVSVQQGGKSGSYAWLAGVFDDNTFVVLGHGAGCLEDNRDMEISSARAEAAGVAAGMCKFCGWKGKVTWKLDNKGVGNTWAAMGRYSPRQWISQAI